MPFWCVPLAAWHITFRGLKGTQVALSAARALLRAGGNPFCALRRPPVECYGVTRADPRSPLAWAGRQALCTDCRLESCPCHAEHNGGHVI